MVWKLVNQCLTKNIIIINIININIRKFEQPQDSFIIVCYETKNGGK